MPLAKSEPVSTPPRAFLVAVGAQIAFALFFRGARDLWSATFVTTATMALFSTVLFWAARSPHRGFAFPLWPALLTMLAAITASLVFSSNKSESFLSFMDWLTMIFIFLMAANLLRARKNIDFFLAGAVPILGVECGIVLWQMIRGDGGERTGTLVNANLLAAFVLPWMLLFLQKVKESWRRQPRQVPYWAAGFLAALGCFVPAQSAGGWICLIIGGTALFLISQARPPSGRPPPLPRAVNKWVFAVLMAAGLVVLGILYFKFSRTVRPDISLYYDVNNRLYWWVAALHMFRSFPWFGIGLGNYQHAYLTFKTGGLENTLFAHSFPFQWLAEAGLVGIGAGIFFLVTFARHARTSSADEFDRRPFLVALGMLLLFSTFNIGLEYLINMMMVGVLFGLTLSSNASPLKPVRFSVAFLAAGIALIALPYIASPFLSSRFIVSGQQNFAEQKIDLAERDFQNAVEVWRVAWEPYVGLAKIAALKAQYREAVEWQNEALERNKLSLPLKKDLEAYLLLAASLKNDR